VTAPAVFDAAFDLTPGQAITSNSTAISEIQLESFRTFMVEHIPRAPPKQHFIENVVVLLSAD